MRTDEMEVEQRWAIQLASCCSFVLLASYYILRPLRDTAATVVGVARLHELFTATFIGTVIASVFYTAIAARVRLTLLLPGAFLFWLSNIVAFAVLFHYRPSDAWLCATFFVWFSVVNLFMISVFWSLMVDMFSATQATRCFARIAAGGALGSIAGPLITRFFVGVAGITGMLLLAAAGLGLVAFLMQALIRVKRGFRGDNLAAQQSSLDHALPGAALDSLRRILRSPYVWNQAAFMMLMTCVNTVAYFSQTDMVARSYPGAIDRARVLADIDLTINILTAVMLFAGTGRLVKRFGVTCGLVLNPLMLAVGFVLTALSPTLLVIQTLQVVRCVGQYAVARPSREICFTVVEQEDRYKAKNVVDTVVYRLGDLISAWLQAGMRSMGFGIVGAAVFGIAGSLLWGVSALRLGKRFERDRGLAEAGRPPPPSATCPNCSDVIRSSSVDRELEVSPRNRRPSQA